MVTLADLRQQRQDLQGRVGRLEGIENRTEGQTARLETAQERLARNRQQAQNIRDTIQNPRSLMQVARNLEISDPEGEGLVGLAYTLATQTRPDIPAYQVADFTTDQQAAFERARQLQGAYDPYLRQGYETTLGGIGAMGSALGGTQALAGQIPGALRPGERALENARQMTRQAARSSNRPVRQAMAQIDRSQGRMGDLSRTVGQDLGRATQGALGTTQETAARARASTAQAQQELADASRMGRRAAAQGIARLQGTGRMYSPDMIAPFMSQYEDAAVQQALKDIARQGDVQGQRLAAQAVGAGAFGGSRQAIAEAELARNVLEQQGRTAAQMRASGFESAAQLAQQAFEQAQGRRQQAAQLTGQLGQVGAGTAAQAAQAAGQLGLSAEELAQTGGLTARELQGRFGLQGGQFGLSTEQARQQAAQTRAALSQSQAQQLMAGAQQAGNLGLQQSQLGLQGIQAGLGAQQQAAGIGQGLGALGQQQLGFGQAAQQLGQQDVNMMYRIGQQQQAQQQAVLDAQRMTQQQEAMLPYQQLAFASDIITGAPTGITSVMSQPGPSPASQAAGLGLSAGAAYDSGIFGP